MNVGKQRRKLLKLFQKAYACEDRKTARKLIKKAEKVKDKIKKN